MPNCRCDSVSALRKDRFRRGAALLPPASGRGYQCCLHTNRERVRRCQTKGKRVLGTTGILHRISEDGLLPPRVSFPPLRPAICLIRCQDRRDDTPVARPTPAPVPRSFPCNPTSVGRASPPS